MDIKSVITINKRFVIVMLTIIGIALISSYSYALWQFNFIKSNVVVLQTASNLTITTTIDDTNSNSFTLPASGNKTVVVHLDTNGITSAMAYKMYYELTGNGKFTVTSTETFLDDKVEGIMQPYERTNNEKITGKNITLTFTNNSSNALTITLGAIGGFEKTGASLTTQEELLLNTRLPATPNIPNNIILKADETNTISSDENIRFYEANGSENGNGLFFIDSTKKDTNPIYYYRGNVNNNYVLFADYCWKIVRTTETGGTKIIFNGVPVTVNGEKQCIDNTNFEKFTDLGRSQTTSSGSYNSWNFPSGGGPYYSNSYNFNTETGLYTLVSPSTTPYYNLANKYTCMGNNPDEVSSTCSKLYYVTNVQQGSNSAYWNLTYYTYDSYENFKNAITKNSWTNTYVDNGPSTVGYSYPNSNQRYKSYGSLSSGIYYGSGVDSTTYKLIDPVTELNSTHHYTYNSSDIDATGISNNTDKVIYAYDNSEYNNNIVFPKTKNIEAVLNEMLSDNTNTNNNPSKVQGKINEWWQSYNATYGNYLEDIEWCNDRSIGDLGGFNPNGGELSPLTFSSEIRYNQTLFGSNANNISLTNTPVLTCSNANDNLSVNKGNLTYPIALLTADEVVMAGGSYGNSNTNYYLYSSDGYWLLSPSKYTSYSNISIVDNNGSLTNELVYNYLTIRPVVSLKANTIVIKGSGTAENPYVVTQ